MLVSRFYDPDRGAVLVDGHDVRGVALHSLRSQIGVVFEESFLFSDTVRANIAYGRPGASDAEIEAAARVAQAHEFVMALPRGYDSVVGERGLTLSGGQRQRIALARAVLQDPRILILDDATSAVDARTEEQINEGLRDGAGGADDAARRPPPLDPPPRRPGRRPRRGPGDRRRHPRRAGRPLGRLPRPPDRARRRRRRGGRGPGRGARDAGRGPDHGGGMGGRDGARRDVRRSRRNGLLGSEAPPVDRDARRSARRRRPSAPRTSAAGSANRGAGAAARCRKRSPRPRS